MGVEEEGRVFFAKSRRGGRESIIFFHASKENVQFNLVNFFIILS